MTMAPRLLLGQLLLQKGLVDEMQLRSALAHQARWGGRLGKTMVRLGFLDEAGILRAVGEQLGIPFVEIGDRTVPPDVLKLLPEKVMRACHAFPLESAGHGSLVVALSDAGNLGFLDDLSFAAGVPVRPALATEADVDRAIARHLGGEASAAPAEAIELPDEPGDEPMELVERPHTRRPS